MRASSRLLERCLDFLLLYIITFIAAMPSLADNQPLPPPVRTPQNGSINRSLPMHTPASVIKPISDNPTDQEIERLRLFAHGLKAVEPQENSSLFGRIKSGLGSAKP